MSLVRRNILDLVPYIAGKPIEETKRELGLKEVIKLASNENPLGPSPKALEAIRQNAANIHRYPDSQGFYLKKKLARYYGFAPSGIVLGNGSDELIDIIIKTFVEDDENIVTSATTFLEYEIIAKVNGREVTTVPLRGFRYDIGGIRKKINGKTKLVFIANPNNPTGTYIGSDELDAFLDGLPRQVIVVLDEAYDAFIDIDDFPRSVQYLTCRPSRKNVIVMKTFSKAFGLAGLRIGYCLTSPDYASYMERVRQPFNVNLLAQAAAVAALDDKKFLKETRRTVSNGKRYLYDALTDMGIMYVSSVANFILIDTGRDGGEVFKSLLKRGVIVRDMKQYGLGNFIRVTIGTEVENRKFIRALKEVLK